MGSLQDQLLKSGLVSEQKLKESRSKKRKQRKASKGKGAEPSLAQAYAQRARQEQQERDRELNRRREEARRRRELKARLKQLIVPNALNQTDAPKPRYFDHNGKIRKLYVTPEQLAGVNKGSTGIAYFGGRYYLIPAEALRKVHEIEPSAVGFFAPFTEENEAAEDGYEDEKYQIPDDLTW